MSRLLTRRPGRDARKAALRAASTPPSPLRRCAAPSLTTPPHLRFEEVVRERGRRGARGTLGGSEQEEGGRGCWTDWAGGAEAVRKGTHEGGWGESEGGGSGC